jgi:GTP-binding protein
MIKNYLTKRTNLMNVFVLVDSRLEPQKIDLEFINWLGGAHVPLTIVFTKADKQTSNKTHANVEVFKKELMKSWHEMPPYFITSSETRSGKELVMEYIEQCNPLFNATE